jgi:blue light- and temperature-responsive anti-repressor
LNPLIHLIYSSAATKRFETPDLVHLLGGARANNARLGITGMLLFENGSFFQILEGTATAVDQLYKDIIEKDPRHEKVVTIIREPIAKRAFGEWTMGFSQVSAGELDEIVGANDFFQGGSSFSEINPGRAKKLLAAFREGRWRSKIKYTSLPKMGHTAEVVSMQPATLLAPKTSFAFQPIIDASTSATVAYEAFCRGIQNESFADILPQISEQEWSRFDTDGRARAIALAARLGLACNLHLKFMARHVDDARSAIHSTLQAAEKNDIEPSRIILEIDQDKLNDESGQFAKIIEDYRGAGLRISIHHFGAGRAGLNLLEPLRPEMISLNEELVRGIDNNGPRQAIVRGVLQTCNDLGIDLIAKYVETDDEYRWLRDEGIHLIQGNLIAAAEFERLPVTRSLPD